MANPTGTINLPARVATNGTTVVTIKLNEDRFYEVKHRGKTTGGASATDDVFFGVNGTVPTAAYASGENLGTIVYGDPPVPIGPRVSELKLITASGSPTLDLFPSGAVAK